MAAAGRRPTAQKQIDSGKLLHNQIKKHIRSCSPAAADGAVGSPGGGASGRRRTELLDVAWTLEWRRLKGSLSRRFEKGFDVCYADSTQHAAYYIHLHIWVSSSRLYQLTLVCQYQYQSQSTRSTNCM
jgi:hypothetical protein